MEELKQRCQKGKQIIVLNRHLEIIICADALCAVGCGPIGHLGTQRKKEEIFEEVEISGSEI